MLCLLANINRDTEKCPSPFTVDDFHPLKQCAHRGTERYGIEILKKGFIERRLDKKSEEVLKWEATK
jgi:hypothetical protein